MADVRRSHGFPLSIAVGSDVGRVRTNNEDAYGHAWLDDGSLFVIVADGMGGHEAGEVASGLAVRVLEDAVARDSGKDARERLYHGLLEANDAILEEGRRSGTRGMGTTAVSSIFRGNEVHVGLIGDSRLYHIRQGQLVWRTLDHTRVQLLIERGEITEEASRNHPEAGMLTRALGHSRMADGQPLVPDVLADPIFLQERDVLVFCSDGLHDLVDDWEVARHVAGLEPEEATRSLIALANERGGHDNITVAVVIAGEVADPYDPDYVPDTYVADDDASASHEVVSAPTADPLPERQVAEPVVQSSEPLPPPPEAARAPGLGAKPPAPPPGLPAPVSAPVSAESDEDGGISPMMIGGAVIAVLLFLILAVGFGVGIGLALLSFMA